jgi:hypothetical protein
VLSWLFLAALGLFVYRTLTSGLQSLPYYLAERSRDLLTYRAAGESVLRGILPYRDFFIEYPPGSLPAFVLPAALSESVGDYTSLFASEMALVLIAAMILTALSAERLNRAWPLTSAVFAVSAAVLYPVAAARYDAVVALALAGAVFLVASGRLLPAWGLLGFGAAAKLVPALAAIPLLGRGNGRQKAWGVVGFLAVAGAFFTPAYLVGARGLRQSFSYQTERGLQLESLPASVLMKLGWVREVVYEFGAWDVKGKGVELASSLSLPVTAVLLIITALVTFIKHRRRGISAGDYPGLVAAFVLAFMIGAKVLSPQYMIWLLPLIPLAAGGGWALVASGIFLVACWTTTQIFPFHYLQLTHLEPGAVNLLLARNLLLVILWGLMLAVPLERRKSG